MRRIVLAIGAPQPSSLFRFIARECARAGLEAVPFTRWCDWRCRIYPRSGSVELRSSTPSCVITDRDIATLLFFAQPAVPPAAAHNQPYQAAEYEALLFGLCMLLAPRVASQWPFALAGYSHAEQPLTSWAAAGLYGPATLKILDDWGPGDAVLYRQLACHRSPTGYIRTAALRSCTSSNDAAIEVTMKISSASPATCIPSVGHLPVWLPECGHLLRRLLADVISKSDRDVAPSCSAAPAKGAALPRLSIVAHKRDTTAGHLFYRSAIAHKPTTFIDLTYALSNACSAGTFDYLVNEIATAPFIFARPLPRTPRSDTDARAARVRLAQVLRALQNRTQYTINHPVAGHTNVSKVVHLTYLARHGLPIPDTLATNDPDAIAAFITRVGALVFKSASRARSIATGLTMEDISRLRLLPACPAVFQELVKGDDIRVHLALGVPHAISIAAKETDYRFATSPPHMGRADVSPDLLDHLQYVARSSGLALSGTDLKGDHSKGLWTVLEMNRMPAFDVFEHWMGNDVSDTILSAVRSAPQSQRRSTPVRQ